MATFSESQKQDRHQIFFSNLDTKMKMKSILFTDFKGALLFIADKILPSSLCDLFKRMRTLDISVECFVSEHCNCLQKSWVFALAVFIFKGLLCVGCLYKTITQLSGFRSSPRKYNWGTKVFRCRRANTISSVSESENSFAEANISEIEKDSSRFSFIQTPRTDSWKSKPFSLLSWGNLSQNVSQLFDKQVTVTTTEMFPSSTRHPMIKPLLSERQWRGKNSLNLF